MDPFFAAQADDPFDPIPMLIHADWLEERGDATGAAALRGLAGGGTPSLHALALNVALPFAAEGPDIDKERAGCWDGFGAGDHGFGLGITDRVGTGSGCGDDRCDGYGCDDGFGLGEKPEVAPGFGSGVGEEDDPDD